VTDERPENEDEKKDPGEEGADEGALPPPATWAGRKSRDDGEADEADEGVGRGITEEFSLSDEVPEEDEQPPPVEEPPDPDAPEPVEEPPAPGAPPSGETEEFTPRKFAPISDEFDEVKPVTHRYEPPSDEHEIEDEEESAGSDPEGSDPQGSKAEEPEAEATEVDEPTSDPAAPGREAEEGRP